MSMKNSNNTIGDQTHDLPACSAVPQLTAPPRAPNYNSTLCKIPGQHRSNLYAKGLKQLRKYTNAS